MLLTNFLVSGCLGGSSLEAGTTSPPFVAEPSAVLLCFGFLVVLASPKTTLLSKSSVFEANGTLDFLVLAPRLPFFGIFGIGIPTQHCMVSLIERRLLRLWTSMEFSTIKIAYEENAAILCAGELAFDS